MALEFATLGAYELTAPEGDADRADAPPALGSPAGTAVPRLGRARTGVPVRQGEPPACPRAA